MTAQTIGFVDWTKIKWYQCYTCEQWVLKQDSAWICKIKPKGARMCNRCLGVDAWIDLP